MSSDSWKWGAGCWALLRLVTLLAAWASSVWVEGGKTVPVPGYKTPVYSGAAEVLLGSWLRADALWYLAIAENGYENPATFAFFPLFPLLIRFLSPVFAGEELISALFVSNVACLIGLVFLHSFFSRLEGKPSARSATVGLAVFPTSFFLVAPYAEPLLVACGAAALMFATRSRYGWAGVAGGLAALSRPFGILLVIPLIALGKGKFRHSWRAVAGPVLGLTIWLGWVALKTGELLGPLRAQSLWQRELSVPWGPLATFVRAIDAWTNWRGTEVGPYMFIDILAVVAGVALVIVSFIRSRKAGTAWPTATSLAAYSGAVLLIPLATPFPPRPLLSMPRFLLGCFPAFSGLALLPAPIRIGLTLLSATGLFVLTAMYVAARPIF